jgi:hypothetical protein
VVLVINADETDATPAASARLADWYHAWQLAQGQQGHPLPGAVLILTAHPLADLPVPQDAAITPCASYPALQDAVEQQMQAVLARALQAPADHAPMALQHVVVLNSLQQHVSQQLLPALLPQQAGKRAPAVHAIGWLAHPADLADAGEPPWQQAATRHSGVHTPPHRRSAAPPTMHS